MEAATGPLVVRIDAPSRSLVEVVWIQRVVRFVAERTGLAPRILAARDGSGAFLWRRRVVSVAAFVPGRPLEPAAAGGLEAGAAALARIHQALADWSGPPRPRPSPWAPANWPPDRDPAAVVDRQLDRWIGSWRRRQVRPAGELIHGDFFPGNLIWRDGELAAVIDWYEARAGAQVGELAAAIWEFAQVPDRDDLDPSAAARFLDAYRGAGGRAAAGGEEALRPLMRRYLQLQMRYSRAEAAAGDPAARRHVARLKRAFWRLRSSGW